MVKKEILLISYYFPPEKGAAAQRMVRLAQLLQQQGYQVRVWCPLPNYPTGKVFEDYQNRFWVREQFDGILVERLWIWPNQSKSLVKRLFASASFVFSLSLAMLLRSYPKQVFIQCPPMPIAWVGVFLGRLRRKKILLNISDLWPSVGIELGVLQPQSLAVRFSEQAMCWCYRKAAVVFGQSAEIVSAIAKEAPQTKVVLYRNLPFFQNNTPKPVAANQPLKVFYAGLFGVAQGVAELVENWQFAGPEVELHLYGAGSESAQIESFLKSNPNAAIHLHGLLPHDKLIEAVAGFHLALIPLVKPLYGSVPSKIFEWAQMGIPCVYLGGGEGEQIVQHYELGWIIEPKNYKALGALLTTLALQEATAWNVQRIQIWERAQQHLILESQWTQWQQDGIF